jgi:PAS domain S-box-containing protein
MLTANPSTILIVDEQPTNLKMLFSFLQESGFKVLVAQSGESAITKLKKVAPDLILLDVMLPGLDGLETCRRLKATAETKDIPVIFMTALSESLDKIKGLKVGAVDYITKPFQQEEVLARIENQLKIRRLSVQLEAKNQQLQQSQSLLASVLHTSQDGVMVLEAIRDSQTKIVDFKWILANRAAEKMTGRTSHDLLGKQLLVELPGNREAGLFERYVNVVETGIPQEGEFYYDYDGIKAWFVQVVVKLGDGFAVTFRDITDRKQTADALLIAQKRLEDLLSSSPAIIYTCTLDNYRATFVSESAKDGEILEFEYRMRHKSGEWHWMFARETVFARNTDGKPKQILGAATDISDRKRVEEELSKSEERWQLVNKGTHDGIWDLNLKTNEAFKSRRWKEMLGYEDDEIGEDNHEWIARLHPDDVERVMQIKQDYLVRKIPNYAVEFRLECKDGSYKWILGRGQAVWDEAGNPVRMVGSNTDISDRKAIEIALQQSQARLQNLAANIPGMLYEFLRYPDGSYRFAYVSSGCRDINELEPKQILENPTLSFELTHPDDIDSIIESIETSAQTLEPWVWEGRIITPSRTLKWIRGAARPERCDDGTIMWHGVVIDVSDRKAAELELQTAKTALERQIQRVLLQERITQEIRSSLNPKQVFQTAAIQIGEAFGVNRCLIHTYIDNPTPLIPLVAEYKVPGLVSLLNLEIPVIGNPHVQVMLAQDSAIASDNIYTEPLLKGVLPLCQELGLKSILAVRTSYQGKPNGAIGLHQYHQFRHWTPEEIDFIESVAAQLGIAIAQANLLEQERQQRRELALHNFALEKAKLEAESANRAKSHFLSKMSHELRTPLNAILGFTQVMARDESMTPEHQEYLGIINRSGEHLLQLINDILSMSQIEAGQVTLNQNRFDLYRLLDSLEEMLGLNATSKGLELIFTRASDVPQYIQTDESKLRQTLINLLGNALKFTQTGRVTLRVGMGERGNKAGMFPLPQFPTPNTRLWFEVEDTGPGIAPEELSSLFDPFVQSETGRQSMEGTGLGLPISQQFVRLMGGEIAVSSTPGQGAIFRFDIQIGLATTADEKPVSGKRRVMGLEPNQPPYRLLIVEDGAVNRKLLVKILEPLGFEVRTATNGQEGVALWQSWSPHLIWMDVIMPVMDGYEATQYIKQTPKGQNTVIIALTANAFEEQQEAILKAGCDDFLPKPFQREVLLEKIAHHLGVLYVYEQQETPSVCQPPAPLQPMAPEALTVMPASWVTQLHQAALYADDELMKQLIEEIPLEYDSLRRALRALVDNFLLEQIINSTEPPRP